MGPRVLRVPELVLRFLESESARVSDQEPASLLTLPLSPTLLCDLGWNRTNNRQLRRLLLYPLSYETSAISATVPIENGEQ